MKHLKIGCKKHKIDSLFIHDKLHEDLFISTSSFNWNNESGCDFVLKKKLMVKNLFIEKTYVVGTH